MDWIIKFISEKMKCRFTGSIRINLSQGSITNINIEESIRPQQ
jgi:hypothetical protein